MEWNDIYDENRQPTGRVHCRGSGWKPGEYGLVVCVWVYDGRGKLLLTRRASEKSFAGTWENTGGAAQAGEDSLTAVQRELREETGATAERWTSLGLFYPACAYSDEAIEMYLAQGLHFGERHLDADEFLNVARVPLTELVEEVMAGRIPDAKTQIAILKADRLLNGAQ